jgi:hypothetical protein
MHLSSGRGYLCAEATGEFHVMSFVHQVHVVEYVCAIRRYHGILLNMLGVRGVISITDLYCLAVGIGEVLPIGARVAFLMRDEHADNARFLETASANRGANVRVFSEGVSAVAWLCAQ